MALTVSARKRWTLPSVGAIIRVAAAFAALGVSLSITEDYESFGKWFAVVGVGLLIFGLHRFGRMGPDAPIRFEAAPAPRKKKKKKKPARATSPSDAPSSEAPPDASER